jgi:hypothetical protein
MRGSVGPSEKNVIDISRLACRQGTIQNSNHALLQPRDFFTSQNMVNLMIKTQCRWPMYPFVGPLLAVCKAIDSAAARERWPGRGSI